MPNAPTWSLWCANQQRGEIRPCPPGPDRRSSHEWTGRRHRLLRDAVSDPRVGGVLAVQGYGGGLCPRRTAAGNQEECPPEFHSGRLAGHRSHQRFGMGIDEPDVRLVIHADILRSLENHLKEARRAGRDQQATRCVLLYTLDHVERQFSMSTRSRLTRSCAGRRHRLLGTLPPFLQEYAAPPTRQLSPWHQPRLWPFLCPGRIR